MDQAGETLFETENRNNSNTSSSNNSSNPLQQNAITHPIIDDYQYTTTEAAIANSLNTNYANYGTNNAINGSSSALSLSHANSTRNNSTRHNSSNNDSDSSSTTFLRWTTCDEVKRCSVAVISFIVLASLVGSSLVLFWFLWAWFVLYLDLPGVLTPIVWLLGFVAPLCLFRLLSVFPKCVRCICCNSAILSLFGLNEMYSRQYGDTIEEPRLESWNAGQLFKERQKHVNIILDARKELPIYICEIISNYCFHYDILVTTKKNKMIGIYPDSALLHTVAEFSKDVTDLAICEGNIHSVYVLVKREQETMAKNCCQGDSAGDDLDELEEANRRERIPLIHQRQRRNDNFHANESIWDRLPKWLWDPTEHVDMVICKYDLAQGKCVDKSIMFDFQQISNTAVQQLKGLYYRPNYRLLMDERRKKLVVMRDGEFIVFNIGNSINDNQTRSYPNGDCEILIESRRELLARPESTDDREQFLHLREYSWNAAIVIPPVVVRNIIRVVDRVEDTDSTILMDDNDVYVMIPFGDHALFVGNVSTGWLRYLDFSHVEPLSESIIHHISFSKDNLYIYICCNSTLSLLSTANFQPIVTVPFTDLEYTVPVGLIRTPPEEFQLQMMMNRHREKLILKQNKLIEKERTKKRLAIANAMSNASNTNYSTINNMPLNFRDDSYLELDKEFCDKLIESIQKESQLYQKELKKRLESISVIFASTRVFLDPRAFIYRFPVNKCKVVTTQVNSRIASTFSIKKNGKIKRKVFDGTHLLDRHFNDNLGGISAMTDQATGIANDGNGGNGMGNGNGFMDGTQGNAAGGGWYYLSLKYRPWKMHNFGRSRPSTTTATSGYGITEGEIEAGEEDEYSTRRSSKDSKKSSRVSLSKSKTKDTKKKNKIQGTKIIGATTTTATEEENMNGEDEIGDDDALIVTTHTVVGGADEDEVAMSVRKEHVTRGGVSNPLLTESDKIEEEMVHVALEDEMELTIDQMTTTPTTTTLRFNNNGRQAAGAGDIDYDSDGVPYSTPMFNRVGI